MLRLRIAKSLPWVDRAGEPRSPFEEFKLLGGGERRALDSMQDPNLVAWEFGIVTDDWDAPAESKPMTVGAEEGDAEPITCFAVGTELASEIADDLTPLWRAFIAWVLEEYGPVQLRLSDTLWVPERGWTGLAEALPELRRSLVKTDRKDVYGYRVDQTSDIDDLLELWWPSALGVLAGTAPAGFAPYAGPAQTGETAFADLGCHFATTTAYDNVGFGVISRTAGWDALRLRLEARGWIDGAPLDTLLG